MASAGSLRSKATRPKRKRFDTSPIGFFHIDLAEVRTAEGKLYLLVAVDRTSKFPVVELVEKAGTQAAAAFLHPLIEAVPYRIHTAFTDKGIQFANLPKNRQELTARVRGHPFDRLCATLTGLPFSSAILWSYISRWYIRANYTFIVGSRKLSPCLAIMLSLRL